MNNISCIFLVDGRE